MIQYTARDIILNIYVSTTSCIHPFSHLLEQKIRKLYLGVAISVAVAQELEWAVH